MYATFNRFEIKMTRAQAESAYHQGACDEDVDALTPILRPQLLKIGPDAIRKELEGYGAWDDEQLADDEENMHRIVWLAAADIVENP